MKDWGQAMALSIPVDLSTLYDNKATSHTGADISDGFDGDGACFPVERMPRGETVFEGIPFQLPVDWSALSADNIRCDSQIIKFAKPMHLAALHMLIAGEGEGVFLRYENRMNITLLYQDGREEDIPVEIKPWWAIGRGVKAAIRCPHRLTPKSGILSTHAIECDIFYLEALTPPSISTSTTDYLVKAIRLPSAETWNTPHLFALTLSPSIALDPGCPSSLPERISVPLARVTRRWEMIEDKRGQIVELWVINPLCAAHRMMDSHWLQSDIHMSLEAPGVRTLRPAIIHRLMPSDRIKVELAVTSTRQANKGLSHAQIQCSRTEGRESWEISVTLEGADLIDDWDKFAWTRDESDLNEHSAPAWYSEAKFGIFIHWGVYSVPAWADPNGKTTAEWYDYYLHTEPSGEPTPKHHSETWGEDFEYDQFIPMFKADKFDPRKWLDLIVEAGAKYFVFTTKHHDGIALFDVKDTSHRSTIHLGPKRDFTAELLNVAAAEYPQLVRGTYFSLPEWFNPLYKKYAYSHYLFPGGPAHNPWTGREEAFVGYIPKDDFLQDIQTPQARILVENYKTDFMWGDIGGANATPDWLADWYTQSMREGRQVALNNRWGIPGDFDTPEMTTMTTAQRNPWETCCSMDPVSWGYNKAMPIARYRSAKGVIHLLIDVVSKGGNLLLNIGPDLHGDIPIWEAETLKKVGEWLRCNGRAIYDCSPYWTLSELKTEDTDWRFTRTKDKFYAISLTRPTCNACVIRAPLPVLAGDKAALLMDDGNVVDVLWEWQHGALIISLEDDVIKNADKDIAWVFEFRQS